MEVARREIPDNSLMHLCRVQQIRSYGKYLALYDEFCTEVTLYPKRYYYNELFLEIYIFLKNNKIFDTFIAVYGKFNDLLLKI